MRVPKPKTPRRKGWMREFGRVLIYVNWSGEWDGWGDSKDEGTRTVYYAAAFHPFIAESGWGACVYLWRLLVQIGVSTAQPEPPR